MLRIKEVLKEKGITLKDLAIMLGITNVALSRIVNGNTTIETLRKIAYVLDVDVRDLIEPTKSTFKRPLFIKDDNGVLLEVGTLNFQKSQSTPPESLQE
jgi:hypothetical protein|nr:helix-turn-helix transcriptional regulator [uncultured Capnocytophaga sp.]